MKLLRFFLQKEVEVFPYRIAEGKEEYRVKREILSNIRKGCSGTVLAPTGGCGPLRDGVQQQ